MNWSFCRNALNRWSMTVRPDSFSQRLLRWYSRNGRHDLPWQQQRTPYRVWVSEIMLQQTRVETVIPYYQSFMQQFPTVQALANAELDSVLHLWTGLGYYARARNLHRAAIKIVHEHAGRVPMSMDELTELPGIGRSTAGAILALSANQRHSILDGNVRRVLARHRGIGGWPGKAEVLRELWNVADACTPAAQVADYTQAIMDLGATVCLKSKPQCPLCPVADDCYARLHNRQQDYPGKKPRKALPVKKTVFAILENSHGDIMLQQRPLTGIWGGLWSFPECSPEENIENWLTAQLGYTARAVREMAPFRHTFSHYHLDIVPVHIHVGEGSAGVADNDRYIWYSPAKTRKLGLAAPVKSLLEQLARKHAGDLHGQNSTLCKTGQGG